MESVQKFGCGGFLSGIIEVQYSKFGFGLQIDDSYMTTVLTASKLVILNYRV